MNRAKFPGYELFSEVCSHGLSKVRPLKGNIEGDKGGWNFGRGWPPSYWAFGRMRALIALDYALALKPKRVLEVASGDGALCATLALHGCKVVANDLRETELKQALKVYTNAENLEIVGGNIFDLSADSIGKFDLVIACEVIEHIAHSVDFLKQLSRFLTPQGRILVTTPNGLYFRNKLPTHSQIKDFQALEKDQFKPDADGHLFLLTPSEMGQLAQEAGLSIQDLSVWGTPLLSGNCKLASLSQAAMTRPAYLAEAWVQLIPAPLRVRLCTAMTAVMKFDQASAQASS